MRTSLLSVLALLLAAMPLPAEGDPRVAEIKTTAKRASDAFVQRNWEAVLDETHPKLVQMAGGKETAAKQMATGMDQAYEQGMRLQKSIVGDPNLMQQIEGWQLTFVPVMMIMTSSKAKVTINSYMMALKGPEDDRFYLIDGAMLNQQLLGKVAPELAGKVGLPKRRQPRVEPLQKAK